MELVTKKINKAKPGPTDLCVCVCQFPVESQWMSDDTAGISKVDCLSINWNKCIVWFTFRWNTLKKIISSNDILFSAQQPTLFRLYQKNEISGMMYMFFSVHWQWEMGRERGRGLVGLVIFNFVLFATPPNNITLW